MEGLSLNSNSEIPNSRDSPSVSLSLESLLVSLPRIQTTNRVDSNQAVTSMGNNSLVLPSNESLVDTQQFEAVNDSQHGAGLDNLLNPQGISATNNFSSGGYFLDSNLYSGPRSSIGSLSNLEAQFGRRDYMLHNNLNFYPSIMSQNSSHDQPYEAIGRDSFNLGNYLYKSPLTSCSSWNQETPDIGENPLFDNPPSMLQGKRDHMLHNTLNFYPSIVNQNSSLDRGPYEAIGRGSFHFGNYLYNSPLTSATSWNQETPGTGTLYGDTKSESMVESIVKLMTEEHGQHRFQKLFESCNDDQMKMIILQLLSQNQLLINVALNQNGSKSIQKLITLLRRSPIITQVTSVLAKGFCTLMTNKIGRHVIKKCLILLNSQQNKLLYEAAILHCTKLATHQEGCTSLNECINYIRSPQRDRLLNVIAEHSVFLSQDPSGNYVVQRVMDLQNPDITCKICHKLRGSYVRLSLQQSASHVVEKCLESSCRRFGVMDLVASNKLLQVAQDQFGNYVIQKAWNSTKIADSLLHQVLQRALEPHLLDLKFHPFGRNVYTLIKAVVPDHRKEFDH